jgi:hypothetical protein
MCIAPSLDLPFGIKKGIKKLIAGAKAPVATAAGPRKPSFLKGSLQDILLPDPQVTWLPVLTRAARRLVKERKIDLVLITVPPFSSVLLVEKLREEFPSLPIVVDFRDEWLRPLLTLVSFSRSERALRIARKAEASAVTNATAVVAVTEAARREIRARYPQEPEEQVPLIPNGFDATRLHGQRSLRVQSRSHGPAARFVVTYVGSVYASTEPTQLAGSSPAIAAARSEVPIPASLHRPHRGASLPRRQIFCNSATWLN